MTKLTIVSNEPNKPDVMLLPSAGISFVESAQSIFSVIANRKDIFLYGGRLVELIKSHGQYSLEQISPEAFRSRIEDYGRPVMAYISHKDEPVLKPKRCSMDNAKALMACKSTDILPVIKSVSNCAVLTQDLEILGKGFHLKQEVLITQGMHPPEVELNEAVNSLKKLLIDNDFVTESDKSRALSMMILPALKMGGFIKSPCPMDTAEANESQSGKTYRQKVIPTIYNSQPIVVTQKNGGVGSIDESIGAAIATGRLFILLDNFRGNFDSPMLEAIITTPETVSVRIPRKAEQVIDASIVTFYLSSNGVATTRDMANRSCVTRIRKPSKPWTQWPEGDLINHVKKNQSYYLGCVFSIVKKWVFEGKPTTKTTDHDMREWAQTMDWIIQNICHMSPLLDGHRDIQKQVSNPQLTWLREVCIQAEQNDKLDFELLAHNIAEICEQGDITYPNKRVYQDDAANKYIGVIMSRVFSKQNSLIIDCYRITKAEKNIYNENIRKHKISKVYKIQPI